MIDNVTESKLHVALSVFPFSSSQAVRASLTRTAHLQKLFTLDTLHFCVFASCISDFNLAEFYKWIYFYMNYSQQIQGRSSILKLQLCYLLLVIAAETSWMWIPSSFSLSVQFWHNWLGADGQMGWGGQTSCLDPKSYFRSRSRHSLHPLVDAFFGLA